MTTVRIPPVLRPLTDEQTQIDVNGDTLAAAFDDLFTQHPDLRSRMYDADGNLQRFVNVYVDDEDVRMRDGLATPLGSDSTVIILPAMAGGSSPQ